MRKPSRGSSLASSSWASPQTLSRACIRRRTPPSVPTPPESPLPRSRSPRRGGTPRRSPSRTGRTRSQRPRRSSSPKSKPRRNKFDSVNQRISVHNCFRYTMGGFGTVSAQLSLIIKVTIRHYI